MPEMINFINLNMKKYLFTIGVASIFLVCGCATSRPESTSVSSATTQEKTTKIIETQQSQQSIAVKSQLLKRYEIQKNIKLLPDPEEFEALEKLNLGSEADWITYNNPQKGLEMMIPYNGKWLNPVYSLNPYDQNNDTIYFGTILEGGEGYGHWTSGQKLRFLPAESKEKTLDRLKQEYKDPDDILKTQTFTIADKEIVEYELEGMCQGGGTIIIGPKYNYELSTECGPNTRQEIITTMRFL